MNSLDWFRDRKLASGQMSRLVTMDRDGSNKRTVFESRERIEAPNWTPDGQYLIVNSLGRLFRVPADGVGVMEEIATGEFLNLNNDHCLSPDGRRIYASGNGHIYVIPIDGGRAERVSNLHPDTVPYFYFLHGISPDEKTLAYVALEPADGDPMACCRVATLGNPRGEDRFLTSACDMADGPEFSPDGQWIYFNLELGKGAPGHAQIWRMRPDGGAGEQLTFDERVNWFPHLSPDGKWMLYVSFPPGTLGHPADKHVQIRVMPANGGASEVVVSLFGGQGTMNVNSWAPDSRRFAYVEYPFEGPAG